MESQIIVVKRSGEKEVFSEKKVLASMQRVGVSEELRPIVLTEIKEHLYPEIKTSEIFSYILNHLREKDRKASLRFNLKQAIFNMGPTGFPFEKYMGRIFENMGYVVTVDAIMQGESINHEVDLVLEKNGTREIAEVKFHNQPGIKTDVHVGLYTFARFLDLKDKNNLQAVWIITNTKLTGDCIRYAQCKNIKVIAWNYPEKNNLQELVEKPSLYPITSLSTLTQKEQSDLIENNIILCSDLLKLSDADLNGKFMISNESLKIARENAEIICKSNY